MKRKISILFLVAEILAIVCLIYWAYGSAPDLLFIACMVLFVTTIGATTTALITRYTAGMLSLMFDLKNKTRKIFGNIMMVIGTVVGILIMINIYHDPLGIQSRPTTTIADIFEIEGAVGFSIIGSLLIIFLANKSKDFGLFISSTN